MDQQTTTAYFSARSNLRLVGSGYSVLDERQSQTMMGLPENDGMSHTATERE